MNRWLLECYILRETNLNINHRPYPFLVKYFLMNNHLKNNTLYVPRKE